MYSQWLYDQEEMHKTYRDYSTYIGAFSNYEMAKGIFDKGNDNNKTSDDRAFDESWKATEDLEDEKILAAQQMLANRKNRKIIR